MISTPDRQNAIALIDQAAAAGARRALACAELGLDERTCRRWQARDGTSEDRRPTAPRPAPSNTLSEEERREMEAGKGIIALQALSSVRRLAF